MTTRKIIYWSRSRPAKGIKPGMTLYMPPQNGKHYAIVHLLVAYNQCCLADYAQMARELRKTFPGVKNAAIRCSKVFDSSNVNGAAIIEWCGHIERKRYEGWHEVKDGSRPEYKFH